MKFLLTQLFILLSSVTFMIYMFTQSYFVPYTEGTTLNWYNLSLVLFLVFMAMQSLVSLVVFLFQKFMAYGWKEFPDFKIALKWGVVCALSLIGGILLNIFNILVFPWGFFAFLLVITLITII